MFDETPRYAAESDSAEHRRRTHFFVLAIGIVSLLPLWWTVKIAGLRLLQPNPQSPWESAILVDAWRARHGLTVYASPAGDHATHMYGPLITYVTALSLLGQGLPLGFPRYLALLSTTLVSAIMARGLVRGRGFSLYFIAATLLLTQFYRTRATITESRPDAVAVAFSALAVGLLYQGHRATARTLWFLAGGVVAMLTGFLFKQTAAAVAVVPLAAVLLTRPQVFRRQMLQAAIPPLCIATTILCVRWWFPNLYFYVVTVPTLFEFRPTFWALNVINLLTTNIVFDLALLLWATGTCRSTLPRPAMLWLLATVVVSSISCGAAVAKVGGQSNSYLGVFVAMAAFSASMLPDLCRRISALPLKRSPFYLLTLLFALALLADATAVPGYLYWADVKATTAFGDRRYKRVVQRVHRLKGKVVCPDDPTIPLRAKGTLNRNIVCELDALGWQSRPDYLLSDLNGARYVVRVGGVWTSQVRIGDLKKRGFKAVADPAFGRSAYILYRRTALPKQMIK